MTKSEIISFINGVYPDPVQKYWKPSEYDMKYKYNTTRRMKKLDADKAKEDAKLKLVFDKEVAQKQSVMKTIDEIATYPSEISNLFYGAIFDNINYLKKCHDKYLELKHNIEKLGQNALAVAYAVQYGMRKYDTSYSMSGRRMTRKTLQILSDEEWTKFADNFMCDYKHPAKDIENPKEFMQMVIDMRNAYDRDELELNGEDAYRNAIIHMVSNFANIVDEIKKHFNGNKPTKCLTDANWGYKGEFCGILTDGISKVSFKSFGAGGVNIQRYHFRFKVTKLK